ncbi:MAG TPA: dienelactone hydrolase family protein [Xanthobacteraceae bacterium]|nr:dienelactone hydrolase family protein [Xanthobacteraceae bacterium]
MRLTAVILAFLATTGAALAAPQLVEMSEGSTKLTGYLYRPDGDGPFPAVVALHGCGGLSGRSGPVSVRYRDWGERLAAAGFAVLFPDSFGSRELASQCTVQARSVRTARERVADAVAARHWLQRQSWVVADRISLLGWQNGAVAALWTIRRRGRDGEEGAPDFRSAVALYPGCRRLVQTEWSARVPTLVLVGAADDWAPATACEQMVAGARGRSAQTKIVVYPGAYADFDHPDRPMRQLTNLAFSADGSGRAHSGTNPAARADAIKRVPEWLAR